MNQSCVTFEFNLQKKKERKLSVNNRKLEQIV